MTEERNERSLTTAERLLVGVFFVVAIGISVVVVQRLGTEPSTVVGPPDSRPVVAPDVPRPVPVRDAIEVATEWARVWNPDAWLILVSSQFSYPIGREQATPVADEGMVIVTFAAPKAGDEWPRLTLAVGRQSGAIYHEDELSSGVEPPAPVGELVDSLPISAEQAFGVAQEVVGDEYREGCAPSRRQVQVVLDTTDRDAPHWVIVYFDERERGTNDIVVRIDALTGGTDTEIRDDTSC